MISEEDLKKQDDLAIELFFTLVYGLIVLFAILAVCGIALLIAYLIQLL